MNKNDKFGSYEAHQPYYEGFKRDVELNNFIYQALVHMGSASHQMSWANTVLENEKKVPNEIKVEMKRVSQQIHTLKEKLRSLKIEE